jgi:hypothetical protein
MRGRGRRGGGSRLRRLGRTEYLPAWWQSSMLFFHAWCETRRSPLAPLVSRQTTARKNQTGPAVILPATPGTKSRRPQHGCHQASCMENCPFHPALGDCLPPPPRLESRLENPGGCVISQEENEAIIKASFDVDRFRDAVSMIAVVIAGLDFGGSRTGGKKCHVEGGNGRTKRGYSTGRVLRWQYETRFSGAADRDNLGTFVPSGRRCRGPKAKIDRSGEKRVKARD